MMDPKTKRVGWMLGYAVVNLAAVIGMVGCYGTAAQRPERPQREERLSFQAQGAWDPRVNLNADVAMVYGIDKTLPERLAGWKARGYIPHEVLREAGV